MGFDVHFTPPGDVDSSWSVFPARSECCPDYTSTKIALLVLGSSYPIIYNPGNPTELARVTAMNALFNATDPADLGEGYWQVRWNFGLGVAEIFEQSVFGYVGAQHFDGTGTFSNLKLGRAKMAVQFGWSGYSPAWRAIDGPTVTVSYYLRTEPLDSNGNRTLGSTIGDLQTLVLDIDPGDTEAWSDWIDFAEPSGNNAISIFGPIDDEDHPSLAFATQGCIGE